MDFKHGAAVENGMADIWRVVRSRRGPSEIQAGAGMSPLFLSTAAERQSCCGATGRLTVSQSSWVDVGEQAFCCVSCT